MGASRLTQTQEGIMAYKLVKVDQETIAGEEIERVETPCGPGDSWIIYTTNGLRIMTTHPVTIIEEVKP